MSTTRTLKRVLKPTPDLNLLWSSTFRLQSHEHDPTLKRVLQYNPSLKPALEFNLQVAGT